MADTRGLRNFKKKVEQAKKKVESGETLRQIAEYGAELAQSRWGELAEVTVEQDSPTKCRIVAKGKGIAYIEYGVGEYAKDTYWGTKPQDWQYYYDSPYKRTVNGQKGWFTTQVTGETTFEVGHSAENIMFETARDMENKIQELGYKVR